MSEPTHRSLLVLDVENSSSLTNVELAAMRATLYRIVDDALPPPEAFVVEGDRGDGALLIFGIPVLDVLDEVVGGLLKGVREHNGAAGPMNWLRVRIAVHEGYVARDERGWSSDHLTTTFRMNSAEVVKAALVAAPRADAVVVVSDSVYHSVVRHAYRETVTPGEYASSAMVLPNGEQQIWVRVPGYPQPPLPEKVSTTKPSAKTAADSLASAPTGSADGTTIHATNYVSGNPTIGNLAGRDNVHTRS